MFVKTVVPLGSKEKNAKVILPCGYNAFIAKRNSNYDTIRYLSSPYFPLLDGPQ